MNELIKKLAEQAFFDESTSRPSTKMYTFSEHKMEKFAELIVKETMQVVANQLPGNQYLDVAHAVIEHFGVEEHHAD